MKLFNLIFVIRFHLFYDFFIPLIWIQLALQLFPFLLMRLQELVHFRLVLLLLLLDLFNLLFTHIVYLCLSIAQLLLHDSHLFEFALQVFLEQFLLFLQLLDLPPEHLVLLLLLREHLLRLLLFLASQLLLLLRHPALGVEPPCSLLLLLKLPRRLLSHDLQFSDCAPGCLTDLLKLDQHFLELLLFVLELAHCV